MKPKQEEKTKKATCRPAKSHWQQSELQAVTGDDAEDPERRPQLRGSAYPDAAGIDIGNESHYVAVPADAGQRTGTAIRVHHGPN